MVPEKDKLIVKMVRIFGNETSLKIILSLGDSIRYSFNDLKRACNACSPSVNYSLMVLIKEGVIKKIEISEKPKRVYYELTDYGKKCLEIIKKFFSINNSR
jgi:DNA-binding HxlR family transcriptional regulator